jgi:thiamine phosphate synthase YjbQ (UPF0047 family)
MSVDVTNEGKMYKENSRITEQRSEKETISTTSIVQVTMNADGAFQEANCFSGHIVRFAKHTRTSIIFV